MGPSVAITVLVENRSSRRDLKTEHGLSLWIEADTLRILFDTGRTGAFLANAERSGVPASSADAVVLSHGHYDHSGGPAFWPEPTEPKRVYLHPAALLPRYSRQEHLPHRTIGMPAASKAFLDRLGPRVTWTSAATPVSGRIGITGAIRRRNDFEDVGGPLFLDPECTKPDTIPDDQALWIETKRGIVVVLGCAHAGVVNTLDQIREHLGERRFRAVIGGLHLRRAGRHRIARTVQALNDYGVGLLAVGHCTGQAFPGGQYDGKAEQLLGGTVLHL